MPNTQHDLTLLRELVAFTEGTARFRVRPLRTGTGIITIGAPTRRLLADLSPGALDRIRSETRHFVRAFVVRGFAQTIFPIQITVTVVTEARSGQTRRAAAARATSLIVNGSPRDVVMDYSYRLLQADRSNTVHACAAPDCERLFVKVTRKAFCSTRCQSRTYMRAMRAAERAEREKSIHGKKTRTR
jgi:CGNR zinc finger